MATNTKPSRFSYTLGSTKISGSPNGCFALITAENKCTLFNAEGAIVVIKNALDGMLLNDGSYFLLRLPTKKSFNGYSSSQNTPVWSLFNKKGTLLMDDLDDCRLYPNGWYRVTKNNHHQLYRADHTLAAEEFSQCAVYPNGYALRNSQTYHKYASWRMYTPQGDFIYNARDTVAILGNGLPLQYDNDSKDLFYLYDAEKDKLLAKNITGSYYFPNGRFVLAFQDMELGRYSKIYEPNGQRFGVSIQNAKFLPDGRFIQYRNNQISGLYSENGLIETDDIWTMEVAGNYYLTGFKYEETLYNDKGKNLGTGYSMMSWLRNFVLLEREQAFHLFNQYGEVMTFPIP